MEKHHSRNQLVQIYLKKQQFSFICFDIEGFYPSISQDPLRDFASNYDNITTEERNIIIHAKNSILIHKQKER